jgi:TonB family protein
LKAQEQKQLSSHSPTSPKRDAPVSSPYDGFAVKGRTSPEPGREASQIISSVRENKTEENSPNENTGATVGMTGLHNTRGVPSPSLPAAYQSLPAGLGTSGDLGHGQVKTQSEGTNTEDGKAIRKAIERALIYPLFARKRGLEGTALTEFTVNAKGYPEDIRITGSTGYSILDTAAKDSMIKAAPFTVSKGRYEIPIKFKLKNN